MTIRLKKEIINKKYREINMKYFLRIFIIVLFFSNYATANDQETIFEGLNAKIVSTQDAMTDKISGAIFLDFGPIYLAIYSHNYFIIWSNYDDLLFAPDKTHLIRVREVPPFSMKKLPNKEGLEPIDDIEAQGVIESLVKGEEVKIRYFDWPKYSKFDRKIQNINFAYIYSKAVKTFGWKDFGIPPKLAPVKLGLFEKYDSGNKGYSSITINGNGDLRLWKNIDQNGEWCDVQLGDFSRIFTIKNGRWYCSESFPEGNGRVVIRNSEGEIVFKGKLPKKTSYDGSSWPLGAEAAKAAWDSAPLGSIELMQGDNRKDIAALYGFRELWEWGIANANLPSLDADISVLKEQPPAKLFFVGIEDKKSKSMAVHVDANPELGLFSYSKKPKKDCYLTLSIKTLFGIYKKKWRSGPWKKNFKIVVRNQNGETVFEGRLPDKSSSKGVLWPLGAEAAKAAWDSAPLGSIGYIDQYSEKFVELYGFKELWEWGISNAGFPVLD